MPRASKSGRGGVSDWHRLKAGGEPLPLRPQRLRPAPGRPWYRTMNRSHISPPEAVRVRLHVARAGVICNFPISHRSNSEDEVRGREQFAVGKERLGCRRSLLRCEGLSDAQPGEGEPDGRHGRAESVGGGSLLLRDRLLGLTMLAARRSPLVSVVGSGGCCGHTRFLRGRLLVEHGQIIGPVRAVNL